MQRQSTSWVRYVVLAWLCLAATIAYIQRNSIAVAEKTIRTELNLTEGEMGLAIGAFFAAYALFQIPTGWLADTWGTRRALSSFVLIFSVVSAAVALVAGFPSLFLARLGMGSCQAGIFPASTNTIGKWFPRTRWAFPNGALGGFMQVGNATGAILTGLLLGTFGISWRWLFVVYAVPGVVWAVMFFRWFRDRPADHAAVSDDELHLITGWQRHDAERPARRSRDKTPWAVLFTHPAMAWICAQQFCRAAAHMFFASWFATFLQETRGVTLATAGVLTSMPLWATVAGSLVGGGVSDWVLGLTASRRIARQWLSAASMLACALLILASYWVTGVWLAVFLISAGSFVAAFAGPCSYALTIDMGGRHVASVFSTMNMCGNIGSTVFPLLVPLVLALTGSWDAVLFLFAAIYAAATLCWLPFNADRGLFDESSETDA